MCELSTELSTGTVQTMGKLTQLLNYVVTNPKAVIHFYASSMQLAIEYNALYLLVPKIQSRAAGYFYLTATCGIEHSRPYNGPFHVYCCVVRAVLSLATEAELAALMHISKEVCPLCTALTEMGHLQNTTTSTTDNSTATEISNATVKQQQSKSVDMQFYWVRDRISQGRFSVIWKEGKRNSADYVTEHHTKSHHAVICLTCLFNLSNLTRDYFQLVVDDKKEVLIGTRLIGNSLCSIV
jgi:hypothetical protein